MRSAKAEPAVSWPEPGVHMLHAWHEARPALAVKVPSGQYEHTRSLVAVALALVNDPWAHGAPTAVHDTASIVPENDPAEQSMQALSNDEDPALDILVPAAHVVHGVHAALPDDELN